MSSRLDELRKKLQQAENDTEFGSVFPHWKLDDDSSCTVRFLPDGNADNTYFWVEKNVIKMPFPGVKGGNESTEVLVQVPCMEMYQKDCPVLQQIRPWFDDDSRKALAKKYWKRRSFLLHGFIVDAGTVEDENVSENSVVRFVVNNQIFTIIKNSLMDQNIEEIPTDYEKGLDFTISKTKDGNFADYSTSTWANKESALTQEQRDAIGESELPSLAKYLPREPDEKALDVIREMFAASIAGELYDLQKWGNYYKPFGLQVSNSASSNSSSTSAKKEPADETDDIPFDVSNNVTENNSSDDSSQSAESILNMLRERKKDSG